MSNDDIPIAGMYGQPIVMTPEMMEDNLAKCSEMISSGLAGRRVTVRPVSDDGKPVAAYRACFIGWTTGYFRVNHETRADFGSTTDAMVMTMNGAVMVADPKWLTFEVE